jgi:hypothetical protein
MVSYEGNNYLRFGGNVSWNATTWKCKTDVKIILKLETTVRWLWIVTDVDTITTMLNIRIPVQ